MRASEIHADAAPVVLPSDLPREVWEVLLGRASPDTLSTEYLHYRYYQLFGSDRAVAALTAVNWWGLPPEQRVQPRDFVKDPPVEGVDYNITPNTGGAHAERCP